MRLHAKRVHSLDKAEARELKRLEKISKLTAELAAAKADADVLRAAVDVLTAALKESATARRKRRRTTEGDAIEREGVVNDRRGSPEDDAYRMNDAADAETDEAASGGERTPRKMYAFSAANVLRGAERTASRAATASNERSERERRKKR
jgi:hypothetical protein